MAYYRSGDDRAAVAELEKAMSMQGGGTSFDWFFLAMAHWRLGDRDEARNCFDRAVEWMDRHKPHDDELRRFRAEAQAMLRRTRAAVGRAILLKTSVAPRFTVRHPILMRISLARQQPMRVDPRNVDQFEHNVSGRCDPDS